MWGYIKQAFRIVSVLSILGIILWSIFIYEQSPYSLKRTIGIHKPLSFTGWVVDWDLEKGKSDMMQLSKSLKSIQLFNGYFNNTDELIWDEVQERQLSEIVEQLNLQDDTDSNPLIYITIINDIIGNGTTIQKDSSFINRLVSSQNQQYAFMDELVAIAKAHQLDGIEIDFENINSEDLPKLLVFYEVLYTKLFNEQIKLRIVLEPQLNFSAMVLPEGPEYVVMAYNLFGYHSGPGPKANKKFLGELTAKMEAIPGEPIIALATGGFIWSEDGKIQSVTEAEAALIVNGNPIDLLHRDENSQAVVYSYTDGNGIAQALWYADTVTLEYWFRAVQQRGYSNIALWRLGNLTEESLKLINEIK